MLPSHARLLYTAVAPTRARVALERIARRRDPREPTPAEQRLALHVAALLTRGEAHAFKLTLDRDGELQALPEMKALKPGDVEASD